MMDPTFELQRIRALEDELSRLKDELATTNQGVLALVVELEERDERLRRAHRQIFRELEDALRPPLPDVGYARFGVYYAPAEEAAPTGGDLYDVLTLPGGELQIVVVDVAGHGVAGTRGALTIIHTVRTLALEGYPLESLVGRTAGLLQSAYPDLVGTLLVARLDPRAGVLRVATGGHPPPLVITPDGNASYSRLMGRGVGYPDPGSHVIAEHRLTPGTTVLFYTDGLVEASMDIVAGMDHLTEVAARHHRLPVEVFADAAVTAMHHRVLHSDDTLLIAMRWHPAGSPA
ncbi:PP2C family protein-serine/threonine phosphatase [Thermoactinospora rubra]|uniref:PP2C family protein-serine/threonine phosphatase n=1 Tax=Thermoactinospora rubra TaxID=1088767 RepID=UPI001180A4FB|nr:PP2C family protein-serine/threonine phosphatase [Thermoactinospora rubra]